MQGEAPVVTLVNAMLLSAARKKATEIWVRHDDAGEPLVSFKIDDAWKDEMRPPAVLHAPLVRRLAVMASLPSYGPDDYAQGTIVLVVGEARRLAFDIRVRGHGDQLEALLRPHAPNR